MIAELQLVSYKLQVFISPPYKECPFCSKKTFGVLIINGDRYFRRCNSCFKPTGYETPSVYSLPPLDKKIIYIDQFAISDMMKCLSPRAKKGNRIPRADFYLNLYDQLSRLTSGQFIICPSSDAHLFESILTKHYKDIRKVYDHFSYGISFNQFIQIKRMQNSHLLNCWIKDESSCKWNFSAERVVSGNINDWKDHWYITFPQAYMKDHEQRTRASKKQLEHKLGKIFDRWKTERHRSFNDWFTEEAMAFGPTLFEEFLKQTEKRLRIHLSAEPFNLDEYFGSLNNDLVEDVFCNISETLTPKKEILGKTKEYFYSDILQQLPFNRIGALLWAALARKASLGQMRPPDKGMDQDVEMISVLLPYCDAMFVDKFCFSILTENPVASKITEYGTKIFSMANADKFMTYLKEVEFASPKEHLQALEEVYGLDWFKPNHSLLV